MATTPLKRVGGVARAAMILVALSAAASVVTLFVRATVTDEAEQFLRVRGDEQEFVEAIAPYLLMSFVQGIAVLSASILTIIWMFRVAKNHRALHRIGTWGPGWAIGGWFLPPLLYVIPTLMFGELWKASNPDVPVGGDWKSSPKSPVILVWFALYSLVPLVLLFWQGTETISGIGSTEVDLAEQITGSQTVNVLSALVGVAGAAAFIAMARQLTGRHQRLTGERS
jgi:hypothetical protein